VFELCVNGKVRNMIKKSTLDFLKGLKQNNNRGWFNKHKDDYQTALTDMEQTVDEMILAVEQFDSRVKGLQPKDALFRIYRDVRFAKDKSPYKEHFGAVIAPQGRKTQDAMYYFHLEPGNSFLAGGLWHPPTKDLHLIRGAIEARGKGLQKIVNGAAFTKNFGKIEGDTLKTVPRGYDKEHPQIDLLRHKDLLAIHHLTDKQVLSPGLVKNAAKMFKAMRPLNDWLNAAMRK